MSVRASLDVFCDKCGQWEHGGGERTKRKARQFVHKHYPGWVARRDEDGRLIDLCPRCDKERKSH
jgi:hypothetical protein